MSSLCALRLPTLQNIGAQSMEQVFLCILSSRLVALHRVTAHIKPEEKKASLDINLAFEPPPTF